MKIRNKQTGEIVSFEWKSPRPPTEQDFEEIFAAHAKMKGRSTSGPATSQQPVVPAEVDPFADRNDRLEATPTYAERVGGAIKRGALELSKAAPAVERLAGDFLYLGQPNFISRDAAEKHRAIEEEIKASTLSVGDEDIIETPFGGLSEGDLTSAGESAVQMLPGLGLGVGAASAKAAASLASRAMGVTTGLSKFGERRTGGTDFLTSAGDAVVQGVAEAYFEEAPALKFFERIPGGSTAALKVILDLTAAEVATEIPTTVIQGANDYMRANPGATMGEVFDHVASMIPDTIKQSIAMSGGMSGVKLTGEAILRAAEKGGKVADAVADKLDPAGKRVEKPVTKAGENEARLREALNDNFINPPPGSNILQTAAPRSVDPFVEPEVAPEAATEAPPPVVVPEVVAEAPAADAADPIPEGLAPTIEPAAPVAPAEEPILLQDEVVAPPAAPAAPPVEAVAEPATTVEPVAETPPAANPETPPVVPEPKAEPAPKAEKPPKAPKSEKVKSELDIEEENLRRDTLAEKRRRLELIKANNDALEERLKGTPKATTPEQRAARTAENKAAWRADPKNANNNPRKSAEEEIDLSDFPELPDEDMDAEEAAGEQEVEEKPQRYADYSDEQRDVVYERSLSTGEPVSRADFPDATEQEFIDGNQKALDSRILNAHESDWSEEERDEAVANYRKDFDDTVMGPVKARRAAKVAAREAAQKGETKAKEKQKKDEPKTKAPREKKPPKAKRSKKAKPETDDLDGVDLTEVKPQAEGPSDADLDTIEEPAPKAKKRPGPMERKTSGTVSTPEEKAARVRAIKVREMREMLSGAEFKDLASGQKIDLLVEKAIEKLRGSARPATAADLDVKDSKGEPSKKERAKEGNKSEKDGGVPKEFSRLSSDKVAPPAAIDHLQLIEYAEEAVEGLEPASVGSLGDAPSAKPTSDVAVSAEDQAAINRSAGVDSVADVGKHLNKLQARAVKRFRAILKAERPEVLRLFDALEIGVFDIIPSDDAAMGRRGVFYHYLPKEDGTHSGANAIYVRLTGNAKTDAIVIHHELLHAALYSLPEKQQAPFRKELIELQRQAHALTTLAARSGVHVPFSVNYAVNDFDSEGKFKGDEILSQLTDPEVVEFFSRMSYGGDLLAKFVRMLNRAGATLMEALKIKGTGIPQFQVSDLLRIQNEVTDAAIAEQRRIDRARRRFENSQMTVDEAHGFARASVGSVDPQGAADARVALANSLINDEDGRYLDFPSFAAEIMRENPFDDMIYTQLQTLYDNAWEDAGFDRMSVKGKTPQPERDAYLQTHFPASRAPLAPKPFFVFEPVTKAIAKALRTTASWTRSRGWFDEATHKLNLARKNAIAGELKEAQFLVGDLEAAVKKAYKGFENLGEDEESQRILNNMNAVLTTPAKDNQNLPDGYLDQDVVNALVALREKIDGMTNYLRDHGALTGKLVAVADRNIGYYIHRSYAIFDDANFKFSEKAIEAAKERIKAENPKKTQAERDSILKRLMNRPDFAKDKTTKKTGGASAENVQERLELIRERQDVPPWVRELWGEHKDTRLNAISTLTNMAFMAANHDFLKRAKYVGLHSGLLSTGKNIHPDHTREILKDDRSGPMAGIWTDNETADAFNNAVANTELMTGKVFEWFRRFNGAAAFSKTVLSPMTHWRNLLANTSIAVAQGFSPITILADAANGNVDTLKNFRKAARAALGEAGWDGDASIRKMIVELTKLGLLNDSPSFSDVIALQKAIAGKPQSKLGEGANALSGVTNTFFGGGLRLASSAYQAEDNVWKVFHFFAETARYKKALAKKNKSWSPEKIQKEAEYLAIDAVRNTTPSYALAPAFAKFIRDNPVTGLFAGFPLEMARVVTGSVVQTRKDAEAGFHGIAFERALGHGIVASLLPALGVMTMGVFGGDDERERDFRRHWLPERMRNTIPWYSKDKEGKIVATDMSAVDAYAYPRKIMIAFARGLAGEGLNVAIAEATSELVAPFTAKKFAYILYDRISKNKDQYGRKLWREDSKGDAVSYEEMWRAIGVEVANALEPGAVATIGRAAKAARGEPGYDLEQEMISWATGLRITSPVISRDLTGKAYAYKTAVTENSPDVLRAKNSKLSKEERLEALRYGDKAIADESSKLLDAMRSAVHDAGMSRAEVNQALRKAGLKDDMIRQAWSGRRTRARARLERKIERAVEPE